MEISSIYRLYQQHPQITTDSRNCPEGSVFFALRGARFNGNTFARKALEMGCAYAVIDEEAYADPTDKRLLLVDDSLKVLQKLANYHRRKLATRILAITGTNGKTTTKELIAHVLMKKYRVLYTQGNYNNAIGVPLTLLRLTPEHEIAVIEMGASHPGDIKELVEIAEPDYGIITNVGKAHLEGFGSFDGVIHTKGELFDYLRTQPQSVVFLHNGDPYLEPIAAGLSTIRYGTPDPKTTLMACGEVVAATPFLHFRWRHDNSPWHEVTTHLIGTYNLDNLMAAVTVGRYFGVLDTHIDEALTAYIPTNNRSQLVHTTHNHLIVDAYNANPTSMATALTSFCHMKVSPKMVILGDMKELGTHSVNEHQHVADLLSEYGFDRTWLVGKAFATVQCAAAVHHFAYVDEVVQALKAERPEGFHILIKGSNSIRLSELIPYL